LTSEGAGADPGATSDLHAQAARILERHWRESGFTVPHPDVYPWRWLWDSCFHALARLALGDERALDELRAVFRWQHTDGFVPHIGYEGGSAHHSLWGRSDASTLTQPPMYGHAVAALLEAGVSVPDELVERAAAGVQWILRNRRRGTDRVVIVHPWESGCDDSPHWDAWCPGPGWDRTRWYDRKGELVRALRLDSEGAALSSSEFEVDNDGFNALVAFNAERLGIDHGLAWEAPPTPGEWVLTLDDLLVALVWPAPGVLDLALDESVLGGAFGPAGVRRDSPGFDPDGYWRGAAWPHLAYLLWLAARRAGRADLAAELARRARAGVVASGWAEHWNPDTGAAGGARPHSWATVVVAIEG